MRRVHRWIAVFAVVAGIYYGSTGLLLQTMDLRALYSRAPATSPTMQSIRVGINGTPNFQVIREPDYAADPLPADFDFETALTTVVRGGRATIGNAPVSFLEFRVLDGERVGQLASQGQLFRFDATTGASLGAPSAGTQ